MLRIVSSLPFKKFPSEIKDPQAAFQYKFIRLFKNSGHGRRPCELPGCQAATTKIFGVGAGIGIGVEFKSFLYIGAELFWFVSNADPDPDPESNLSRYGAF
jgi:hypothetical protein